MIKKKVLSIGCAVVLAFSYLGTRVFANYGTGSNNSAEVEMTVDYNGNTVYEYTDADGVTRTSTTTDSIGLTKNRFDKIYGINKWDSDNIVVTVKEVPKHRLKLLIMLVKLLVVLMEHSIVKMNLGVQKVVVDWVHHIM